jgi:hypothetical protein
MSDDVLGAQYGEGYADWLDNTTLYGTGIPTRFLNLDTGAKSVCPSPPEFSKLTQSGASGVIPTVGHGVYFWEEVQTTQKDAPSLFIGRYAPDLPVADHWMLSHDWIEPEVTDVAPDGRSALVRGASAKVIAGKGWEKITSVFYLVSLESELVIQIPPAEKMPILDPSQGPFAHFLHDGRRFAVEAEHQLFVCDTDSKKWTSYAAPDTVKPIEFMGWVPPKLSPDRRSVALVSKALNSIVTIDLDNGVRSSIIFPNIGRINPKWLGNDRLIVSFQQVLEHEPTYLRFGLPEYFVINRDGSGKRELFPGNP